jgi:glycosyltransferase involved in cell wall biosynthesis
MTANPARAAAAVRAQTVRRVTLVLGTSAGGVGTHARMLAAGLAGRGIAVSVAAPLSADARFSFSALPGVSYSAVEISDRPRAGDLAGIARLRTLLLRPGDDGPYGPSLDEGGDRLPEASSGGGSRGGGDVVHAHGMRAGALTVLALSLCRGGGRPRVVVTVHNAPPGKLVSGFVYRSLERVVARGADLVLCVSPDLEVRMHAAGARAVGRAVIAAPAACPVPADSPGGQGGDETAFQQADGSSGGVRPPGRPVVFAAGRLAAQKGFAVLLEAASGWRDLEPMPLVVIAGDGPLAEELRARAAALGAAAVFLGHRDDVPARLAAAGVFVLPSFWEGQPLVLQEALRAGVPIVATRVGGIPDLTGEDAALLVPPGDARALAAAVRAVLTDQALAARLRTAARARAAALPQAGDAVTAVLAAYAAVIR